MHACVTQGGTVLWHPQWLEFPELTLRCDVVIKGPRLDDALGLLTELLVSDLQELEAVPVYFVEGLRLVETQGAQAGCRKLRSFVPVNTSCWDSCRTVVMASDPLCTQRCARIQASL
jgi:hypothetical protein